MTWKDLSELHLASLRTEDDALFDKVLGGKIAEAYWKIDQRKNAASSSSSLYEGDDDAALADAMKAFGVERFVDMGDPPPPAYLVRNCVELGHPTYIYGKRGSLKSMNALAWGIAIASPDVESIMGYAVENHGPVVLFDSELNNNVFNDRALKICRGLGIDKPKNLYYKRAVGVHPSTSFPELHGFCDVINVTAVIIDSLGFAVRGDPESYKDSRNNTTEYIDPLIAKNIAVILVEHKPHQGDHLFGSVSKEYHARYIFQTKDLDGDTRVKGERNTQLVNEKASFTEEGHKITLVTRFSDDKIVIEPQGTPNAPEETTKKAAAEVKVRRSLMVSDKTTRELADDTGVSNNHLRNTVMPSMRKNGAVFEVGTKGQSNEIVWSLNPPEDAASSSRIRRDDADDAALSAVIEDDSQLGNLVGDIEPATVIALDLETMPPAGWKEEVLAEYRTQLAKLKKRPKVDSRRKRLTKIKESIYKKYATKTDTAVPRIVSVATPGDLGTNALVDVSRVDPGPLLTALRDKTLITHNGTFDLGVLRKQYGYVHDGRILDTQLLYVLHHYAEAGEHDKLGNGMWRLCDPRDTRIDLHGTGKKDVGMTALAAVVKQHLNILLDKGSQASDWSVSELSEDQIRYALMDTRILLDLSDTLVEKLTRIGMANIVDLESRAFRAQVDMELNGFPADKNEALGMAEKYQVESEAALARVHQLLPQEAAPDGKPWNWNADNHIRAVLRLLGANIDKKTYPKTENTGEPSTAAKALRTITKPASAKEWVDAYLAYVGLNKSYNDFAKQYAGLIREDGTIKGSFDTVSTGRLSCRRPNLQQVPKRGELQKKEGMRIRNIFRPAPGDKFIVADFAQVELLLAATVAKREASMRGHMLEVFQSGEYDIHIATAATMTGKPVDEVTGEERTLAKAVNFGLVYGAEAETLMEYARNNYGVTDMTLEDAKAYRKAFFELYPELAEWHRIVEKRCDQGHEYATTPMGRRRKLPKWMSSGAIAHTTAKNSPIQGAGADAIKLTLAKLFEDRHACLGNPRLNCCIHDEVVLSVEERHANAAVEWVKSHMAAAEREAVGDPESPVVVDVEAKDSW